MCRGLRVGEQRELELLEHGWPMAEQRADANGLPLRCRSGMAEQLRSSRARHRHWPRLTLPGGRRAVGLERCQATRVSGLKRVRSSLVVGNLYLFAQSSPSPAPQGWWAWHFGPVFGNGTSVDNSARPSLAWAMHSSHFVFGIHKVIGLDWISTSTKSAQVLK